MSKHLGNRIGYGVNSYSDGGFFNLSSQSFLIRKNKWVSKAVVSGGLPPFSPGNGYIYTIFTSTGTLTISNGEIYIDYVIIAGGAPGAPGFGSFTDTSGGGGGAGGFLESSALFYPGTYTITVGGSGSNSSISGPSLFGTKIAIAGGTGGVWPQPVSGTPGGSGGGGGGGISGFHGGDGTGDQGTPGGYAFGLSYTSGGGGGAGGSGGSGTSSFGTGGSGGIGRAAFLGDTGIPSSYGTSGPSPGRWFAGGGAGASGGSTPGAGGVGGSGAGGIPSSTPLRNGVPGTANTGSGGGGGAASPGGGFGGSGGSGIVILRYKSYT